MSVDLYFCFCCMSTNDLSNLLSYDSENNYFEMIKVFTSIQAFEENYDNEGYICNECVTRLKEAIAFRKLIFETLSVLQGNGLIKLCKINNTYLVKKITECEDTNDDVKYLDNIQVKLESSNDKFDQQYKVNSNKRNKTSENKIKLEPKETCILKKTDNEIILKNEKKITVARKIKRETNSLKQIEPSYKVTKDLKCKICSEEMPNAKVFHTHMNKHFPNHICETCGKGFATEIRLKRHAMSHYRGHFPCAECEAVFNNYNAYSSHKRRLHSTVLTYACPLCPQRFGTYTRRARHLADAHASSARHRCPVCPKAFLVSGTLSAHIRSVHKKVVRYSCSQCDMGFFHKQDLVGHMASHTGVNLYQCNLCTKSYPRKYSLSVHMLTHTGEKRFCCETCGKRFTQKCVLIRHYRMHLRRQEPGETDKSKEQSHDILPTLVIGVIR